MANARQIPGASAHSEGRGAESYVVDVVQGHRGALEAKFRGLSFTLEREHHPHYRWRCAVETCSSRLETTLLADEHSMRKFKDHDEAEHQKMNNEDLQKKKEMKRLYDAGFRNQPVKIGGFRYVLEKVAETMHYWRCEYMGCPGRCHTDHNFRVVAGPTRHLQEFHAVMDQLHSEASRGSVRQPDTISSGEEPRSRRVDGPNTSGKSLMQSVIPFRACNVTDTSTAMRHDRTITDQGMPAGIEGGTQEASRDERAHHQQEQRQRKDEKKRKLQDEVVQRGGGQAEQKRDRRFDSPVSSSPPVSERRKHYKHHKDNKRHKHHHDPVSKQSVMDSIAGEPCASSDLLFKQKPSSASPEASALTIDVCDSRSSNDNQKTQEAGTVQAGSPGKSLATGGLLHRPDRPRKEPVESVSPRKQCEAVSNVKKEQQMESSDCKDASVFESDDDRSTLSMEGEDTNLNEESTLGLDAARSNVEEAAERREHVKVEDEHLNTGGNYETPSHVRAAFERNESSFKAEHDLLQARANCEETPVGEVNGNRPETSASHEGEATKKADDKRSHKSANRLSADSRSPEPSTSYRGPRAELPHIMTGASSDSRERELRAALLIQTRRLLEVQTELVNQERSNEAMRRMLLMGIVPNTEPCLPFK